MITLYTSLQPNANIAGTSQKPTLIAPIETNITLPIPLRKKRILFVDTLPEDYDHWLWIFIKEGHNGIESSISNFSILPSQLWHLECGDVVRLNTVAWTLRVLYRIQSTNNYFLMTERCNSYCVMCSQPPRDINDDYLVDEILETIPLISQNTNEIGFSGGEPTLLGDRFITVLQRMNQHLPRTAVHILSNGRNFNNISLAKSVAKINHPDLMIGIPLYADISELHDFIVQADNAFDETIRGILNLKRCGVKVEVRVVIHALNYTRLPQLAEFIARNLLFVDHVALMGLELTGFAKTNIESLWIDPYDYRVELEKAVEILLWYGMNVSIYNLPLCLISANIRQFATQSISDWKNEFYEECIKCQQKESCSGFFYSAKHRTSLYIKAL